MDSTGEDVLDDILLEHHKDGIHTIQKTVSFSFVGVVPFVLVFSCFTPLF